MKVFGRRKPTTGPRHVVIAPCGEKFCGKIARSFKDGREVASPNLGKTLVIDMALKGDGTHSGEGWCPSS